MFYTLLGDGEIQEGQVWEAAMFAGAKHLDNLVVIVDNNGLQIDGNVADVTARTRSQKKKIRGIQLPRNQRSGRQRFRSAESCI